MDSEFDFRKLEDIELAQNIMKWVASRLGILIGTKEGSEHCVASWVVGVLNVEKDEVEPRLFSVKAKSPLEAIVGILAESDQMGGVPIYLLSESQAMEVFQTMQRDYDKENEDGSN